MSELMVKQPWFPALQARALKIFEQLGFPDKHNEDWKYTPLDTLLQHQFTPSLTQPNEEKKASFSSSPIEGYLIQIIDGELILPEDLPQGLRIMSLLDAIVQYPQLVQPYLAKMRMEQGFQALNTAQLTTGLFIHIERGLQLAKPIVLRQRQTREEQAVHVRHLLVAEEQVSAALLEVFEGEGRYFNNEVVQIFLAQHAKFIHYKMLLESSLAFHISHMTVHQKALSQFSAHTLTLGGALVRNDLEIYFEEPNAHCYLNGMYLPKDKQFHDHHIKVHHLVPHCTSFQDFKGILQGVAKAVFNGKVIVAQNAQKTEAHQYNKNLLLSLKAEINTQPQLEIFADDVVCTHGATVGQLDEEALFYLATRGFSRQKAIQYLVQGFVFENLKRIPMGLVSEWMTHLINLQLGVTND